MATFIDWMKEKYVKEQQKAANQLLVFIFSNPQDATLGIKDNKYILCPNCHFSDSAFFCP